MSGVSLQKKIKEDIYPGIFVVMDGMAGGMLFFGVILKTRQ